MRVGLICGGAQGVWDERAEALDLLAVVGAEVVGIAVNDAGTEHPDPLDHWCSLHPNKLFVSPFFWERKRAENGWSTAGYLRWSVSKLSDRVDRTTRQWTGGSSGLLALEVALLRLNLDGAILCGVPMDGRLNQFRGEPWRPHERFRSSWLKIPPEHKARARSMSGWTRDLLGCPTLDWLRSLDMPEPDAAA